MMTSNRPHCLYRRCDRLPSPRFLPLFDSGNKSVSFRSLLQRRISPNISSGVRRRRFLRNCNQLYSRTFPVLFTRRGGNWLDGSILCGGSRCGCSVWGIGGLGRSWPFCFSIFYRGSPWLGGFLLRESERCNRVVLISSVFLYLFHDLLDQDLRPENSFYSSPNNNYLRLSSHPYPSLWLSPLPNYKPPYSPFPTYPLKDTPPTNSDYHHYHFSTLLRYH